VAELVAEGATEPMIIEAVRGELTELLHLYRCEYEQTDGVDGAHDLVKLERSGVLLQQVHRLAPEGVELPVEGVAVPVLARGRAAGRFVLYPRPGVGVSLEDRIVAVTLVDQVGAALAGAHTA
jgi:hypothetical protein